MKFLEKDLEDIIFETDNKKLRERGLNIIGKKKRQFYIGNYGIADMITYSKITDIDILPCGDEKILSNILFIQIFELKKDVIDVSAFIQSIGYLKGINQFINKNNPALDYKIEVNLIGNHIEKNNFCYLSDFVDWLAVYSYDYDFDGIKFTEESGYKLTDNKF